jgi:hypothetical protein
MRLNDIVAAAFSGATAKFGDAAAKLRRNAILYAICAVCAVTAIVFAASASLIALEPAVGVVYARLILAGAFAFVAAAAVLILWVLNRSPAVPRDPLRAQVHAQVNPQLNAQAAQRSAQFAQLAMIVEAVLLGYSMARKR